MTKLLKYLKPYTKECILAPLFKLLEAIFELFVPLVMASIIDDGIRLSNNSLIINKSLLILALGILGLIAAISAQYFAAKAAVGFSSKLRFSLIKHISKLSYNSLDSIGTSTLINRINGDVNQVQTGLNLTLRLLLRSPFIVFGAMIMAYTISKKLSLIFAVVIVVLFLIVFLILFITIPMHKKAQKKQDGILLSARENLAGVRVIRAFCAEDKQREIFQKKNESYSRAMIKTGRVSALLNPLTYVVINLGIVVLIKQGAISVSLGDLTGGEVIALYNYMSQILVELIKLANLTLTIPKSLACASRVSEVLSVKNEEKTGKIQKEKISSVEFKNVSFSYHSNGENAIRDISFSAKAGETIGIIGATASGKSTLVNLIPAFYLPSEGEILINGESIEKIDKDSLRGKIGVVPQKALLFEGSIRENILLGRENTTEEEIKEALRISQALDFAIDKGLDFHIEQGGKNLSGGQRQRLTIARAIIKKPEIIILDDSSSALDYQTDSKLRDEINKIENNPIVFIVSQRTASVMKADRIIVLEDGEIVGMGTHEELINNCEVYKEIYNSQK